MSTCIDFLVGVTIVLSLTRQTSSVVLFNVGLPRTGTTSVHKALPLFNFSSNHVAFNSTRFDLESQIGHLLHDFRKYGSGQFKPLFDSFDGFSDTPCYGIIPAIKKFYPNAAVVATWRNKSSWLGSLKRNPSAGGAFLTGPSNLLPIDDRPNQDDARARQLASEDTKNQGGKKKKKLSREERLERLWTPTRKKNLETIYDNHAKLLKKFNIPVIDLAGSSQSKFEVLLDNLPDTAVTKIAKKCLSENRLTWPLDNVGTMNTKGCNRIIPNMSISKLNELASSCDFSFENACIEAQVVYPEDRHPGSTSVHAVKDAIKA